jgi:hypothetical protein
VLEKEKNMNRVLQVFLIVCLLVFLAIIIRFLTKKRMNIKYSLVWLFADVCMLIVAIFPKIIDIVGAAVGIAAPVNTVFLFAGIFMLLIIFTLTMIVSHLTNRIYRISQVLALVEKRVRDIESKG